jgi:hypothetical protein
MEWAPRVKDEILRAALAELRVTVASVVEPFLKVTDPVGVPPKAGFTVAVNVTDCPGTDGFAEDASKVEVEETFTVCVSAVDVLAVKLVLPP